MASRGASSTRRRRRRQAWSGILRSAREPEALAVDPVARSARRPLSDLIVLMPLAICAAVGAHVLFTAAVWGAAKLLGTDEEEVEEIVAVAVIEEAEQTTQEEVEPKEDPERKEDPEPEPPPPKPKPKPPPAKPPPPQARPPAPPKRIVGLDLGSTVEGGSGPAFATGTDLRGKTEAIARDPAQAAQEPEPAEAASHPRNRTATRIPGDGSTLVKPRRLGEVRPEYPPELRAQGIEGNVVVQVRIDRSGNVVEATVVSPAPYPEMNAEALAAARKQRFSPATRDGVAIEYTLSYTVRFRLSDS